MHCRTFFLSLLLGIATLPAWAAPQPPAEDAALCAEADTRYAKVMGDAPVPDGVVVVKTFKYRFCPAVVEIAPGTTVRWVNIERTTHNAWLKETGEPEPERLFLGESRDFTFTQPGEYPTLCGPHWEQQGMVGKVVVRHTLRQ